MDSEEEFYYSDPSDYDSPNDDQASMKDPSDDDSPVDDQAYEEYYEPPSENNQSSKPYLILGEDDIKNRQDEEIARVSSTLIIPTPSATLLLCQYNWNADKIINEVWFEDEEMIRASFGLFDQKTNLPESGEVSCGICFDTYPRDTMSSAACGHLYCADCWQGYIGSSINDGPGCLSLRCPIPSYRAVVDRAMVDALATKSDQDKYSRFLLRSYVEGMKKKTIKWCPSPDCVYAVEYTGGGALLDAKCQCSYRFCWDCTEEVHRPANCEMVTNWAQKNKSDAENSNWLLVNSKPCPKCKRFIEKDHGCMHMTCTPPCGFQFCWLCLGDWKQHNDKTGGYYACNSYEEARKQGAFNDEEVRKEKAKGSLIRYTHYFERWSSNHNSMVKAQESLRGLKNGGMNELITRLKEEHHLDSIHHLDFIRDAWSQIVECRRILKWSYVYGFFLPEYQRKKKTLFEALQGKADTELERLHQCAEQEIKQLFIELAYLEAVAQHRSPNLKNVETIEEPVSPFQKFQIYKEKLQDLTLLTKQYFENLVRVFEGGLEEVITETDDKVECSYAGLQGVMNKYDYWYCERCTFANTMDSAWCEICGDDEENLALYYDSD